MNFLPTKLSILGVASLLSMSLFAVEQQALLIDKKERLQVVQSVAKLLDENYIYPEKAKAMASLLDEKLQQGHYKNITDPQKFAQQLTEDIRSINQDLHLRVLFDPQRIKQQRALTQLPENQQVDIQYLEQLKQYNYGFEQVKILDGNIGYLNLTSFVDAANGKATAVSAMGFLANTAALIIDLRENGGGSPSMIQLISSYLFDEQPVHLNSFYYRPNDEYSETWTLAEVEGQRRPNRPVYVLTSKRTFSAAEEFTYNLKHLKRATIIGEVTGGGAHPGGTQIATDRFMVWIPTGKAVNPITKTNWEGVGVQPDIAVEKTQALLKAQQTAYQDLIKKTPENKSRYQWFLDGLNAQIKPVSLDLELLKKYVGDYGDRVLTLEGKQLFYKRKGGSKTALIALSNELFMLPDVGYFRLKVVLDSGKAVALKGLYDNGTEDYSERS